MDTLRHDKDHIILGQIEGKSGREHPRTMIINKIIKYARLRNYRKLKRLEGVWKNTVKLILGSTTNEEDFM